MEPLKKKRTRKDPIISRDVREMVLCLEALIKGAGHGGLSWAAEEIGLTPSGLLKIISKHSLHEPTMKAYSMIEQLRHDSFLRNHPEAQEVSREQFGRYTVHSMHINGGTYPTWSLATQPQTENP